jgi:hypothetical protein
LLHGILDVGINYRAIPDGVQKLFLEYLFGLVQRDLQPEETSATHRQLVWFIGSTTIDGVMIKWVALQLESMVFSHLLFWKGEPGATPDKLQIQNAIFIAEGVQDFPEFLHYVM